MKTVYTLNLKKAEKELIRQGYEVRNISRNCDCGESRAIEAITEGEGEQLIVIECESCYNKNSTFEQFN